MHDAKYLVRVNRGLPLEALTLIDSKEYWQFFLAQALLQGICLSALFSPSFPRYAIAHSYARFNSSRLIIF
jgi:hypothetical protein